MGTGKLGENNGVKMFGVSGKVCSPVEEFEEGQQLCDLELTLIA
jgi:hypothetical protein